MTPNLFSHLFGTWLYTLLSHYQENVNSNQFLFYGAAWLAAEHQKWISHWRSIVNNTIWNFVNIQHKKLW
jgi:hypothetical protein